MQAFFARGGELTVGEISGKIKENRHARFLPGAIAAGREEREAVGKMPFEIVRNDITQMRVDAIVNSANPRPIVGLGTDSSIHEKAGPGLLTARQKIGRILVGHAAITPAFRLPARFVIHTVGPVWDGGSYGEEKLLRSCYDRSLKLALAYGCKSVRRLCRSPFPPSANFCCSMR